MPQRNVTRTDEFIKNFGSDYSVEELMAKTGLCFKTLYSIAKRYKVIPKGSGWFKGYEVKSSNVPRVKGEYTNCKSYHY